MSPNRADRDAPFARDTDLLECLTTSSCNASTNATDWAKPSTAFTCKTGHRGALCAACTEGFFFKSNTCLPCDDGPLLSEGAQAAAAGGEDTVAAKLQEFQEQLAAAEVLPQLHFEGVKVAETIELILIELTDFQTSIVKRTPATVKWTPVLF